MSDKELFKAIKEYEEENNLKDVREANIILRKIRDICSAYSLCKKGDKYCPFLRCEYGSTVCIFNNGVPENWVLD